MIRLFELRRVIGQHISSSHLSSHPPPPGEKTLHYGNPGVHHPHILYDSNLKMSVWVPKVYQSALSWHN